MQLATVQPVQYERVQLLIQRRIVRRRQHADDGEPLVEHVIVGRGRLAEIEGPVDAEIISYN